jgi:hypothetical protein
MNIHVKSIKDRECAPHKIGAVGPSRQSQVVSGNDPAQKQKGRENGAWFPGWEKD